MDLYRTLGYVALGSYMRRLGEISQQASAQVYQMYGMDFEVKWFPVFLAIAQKEAETVSKIAEYIGQSHVGVSLMVKEMVKEGFLETQKGLVDKRETNVRLTEKGVQMHERMKELLEDLDDTMNEVKNECETDVLRSLMEYEQVILRKSMPERIKSRLKIRERNKVNIIPLDPQNAVQRESFKRINYEWIERYFKVEPLDMESLENPDKFYLNKGGIVLLAEYQGTIVGTSALKPMTEDSMELSKMGVDNNAKGLGIGELLGQSIIDEARKMGLKRLYLETNSRLLPALNLYQKLGFKTVKDFSSPYSRADVAMEMFL
ncbi:bifunctional helix-turn-helix transcriptional regulator/GNAT family N-acetyltransferase [Runella sp.]|uniref:bifunctional helix-turn-helix transcriptional regulator/GNAT family N-acetyltransferase n=1 Tax=Runella sp. TaxID=1960881 RepID=UPI003017308C